MDWIDESRRRAFENRVLIRTANGSKDCDGSGIEQDLTLALPSETRNSALPIENELILPYEDALAAIAVATEHRIAVLGFDSGEVQEGGFQVLDYTGYDRDIPFTGDWKVYVERLNIEAERWIRMHPLGRNHGYIITSASQREFDETQRWDRKQPFWSPRAQPRS